MRTHAFIFNWRNQYEKTKEKERQFAEQLPDVKLTVINSDEAHEDDGWVNIGESAYMSDQILKAIELFDGDVMWITLADVSYDNWAGIHDNAEKYLEKYNWGVFAPNVDYTWHDNTRADIDALSTFEEKNLKFVSCTDCLSWFIHKDLIDDYKQSGIDMGKYHIGWGWDVIIPSFSIKRSRPIIRDYDHTAQHPKSTNYDSSEAESQMRNLFESLNQEMKMLFFILKANKDTLPQLFSSKIS